MAYEDVSPPKKRWQQQQSCSSTPSPNPFQLDANQWRHQNILVLDQENFNMYHMAMILDINDSHLVRISMRDQTTMIIDLSRPICSQLPSIIIDNIPACQDLLVDTPVCVRRNKTNQINQFQCGRIRAKHPTRLEFAIDFKDANNNHQLDSHASNEDIEEQWFTRQNIRLLIEPWHEELHLYRENLSISSTMFRPISVDLPKNSNQTSEHHDQTDEQQKIAFPTPPIEHKDDDDDEEIERELDKQEQVNIKLQGIKKGDIFTMG